MPPLGILKFKTVVNLQTACDDQKDKASCSHLDTALHLYFYVQLNNIIYILVGRITQP